MCIRDRFVALSLFSIKVFSDSNEDLFEACKQGNLEKVKNCLLYTSDAADERSSVDLGGRRIIKKKNNVVISGSRRIKTRTKEYTHHVKIRNRT